MLPPVCLTYLRYAAAFLPYLPLSLFLLYLLRNLVISTRKRLSSDLDLIPTPFVPWWKRYTVGHNLLYDTVTSNAFNAAEKFNSWRRDHGHVFQLRSLLGERSVVITSEEAIRTVHITKWSRFVRPAVSRNTLAPLAGENGLLLAEGARHVRLRKAVAPAMHYDALIALGRVFLEEGEDLAKRLGHLGESGGDVLREVRISTFAIIFQTCFGKDAARPEVLKKLQEAYLEAFLQPPWHLFLSLILQKLFWFVGAQRFGWRTDLTRYIRKTIYELCSECEGKMYEGSSVNESPLLSLTVDEDTKKGLKKEEMVDTVLSFLTAGQMTTSLSVTWTLYILAREWEWQDKLHEELKDWCADDGLEALDGLPVLNRIVRESLRLYPPVFYVTRETAEAVKVDGFLLPKGLIVRLPILAIHRNEEIWGADAQEFNPDRFLREKGVGRTRMFWCVFSFGGRSCIGQRFALLEIKAFVAQVVKRLRVFVKPLEDKAPTCRGVFATPVGMKVYFEGREAG